jgi:G:T-mismatch repair DNA endonuclease (very short patch repair protein)
MKIDGLVSLQRFRRTKEQRSEGPHPWEYLIVYECEARDRVKVIEQLKKVSGTEIMPSTTALADGGYTCWFEEITELRKP